MRPVLSMVIFLFLLPVNAESASAADIYGLPVTEYNLRNGMRFVIVERRESPTFSAVIRFKVGSVNESPGQTGMAHLLEHMMFKGTDRFGTTDPVHEHPILQRIDALQLQLQVARSSGQRQIGLDMGALNRELAGLEQEAKRFIIRNELWDIYRRNGGTGLNASTSRDGTQYFVSLPKNRLELWALLESDRIRNPVFREFYTERAVVQEERRERVDTNPRGQLMEAALATAFTAVPYRHPVLGWPGDLENLLRPQAEAYFRQFYAPNNAVVVLVGDLTPSEVIPILERYFGDLPPPAAALMPAYQEPAQQGERRVRVDFPAEPQLMLLYQAPPVGDPDSYPLSVLGSILGEGRSSRLYQKLILEKQVATRAESGPWFLKYAGLFLVQATPRSPHTLADVEAAIDEELRRIQTDPVSPQELLKVRNQVEAEAVNRLASNAGLAAELANAWALRGDWRSVITDCEKLKAVTVEQVQDVARRYLIPSRRTVASLVRTEGDATPSAPRSVTRQPWEQN